MIIVGQLKLQDFFYPIGGVSASGLEGLNCTWAYLQQHFQRLYGMIEVILLKCRVVFRT